MTELCKAWVEENQNYEPGTGNLFLMAELYDRKRGFYKYCIGGADRRLNQNGGWGKWDVTLLGPYDEDTDSDTIFIGSYDTQDEARDALMKAQHQACLPCAA